MYNLLLAVFLNIKFITERKNMKYNYEDAQVYCKNIYICRFNLLENSFKIQCNSFLNT